MTGFVSHPLRTFESGVYIHQTTHLYAGYIGHHRMVCDTSESRINMTLSPGKKTRGLTATIEPETLQFPSYQTGSMATLPNCSIMDISLNIGMLALDQHREGIKSVWPFTPFLDLTLPGLNNVAVSNDRQHTNGTQRQPDTRLSIRLHKDPHEGDFSVNFMAILAGNVTGVGDHGVQVLFASIPENAANDPGTIGRALKECRNPVSKLGLFALQSFLHRANSSWRPFIEV